MMVNLVNVLQDYSRDQDAVEILRTDDASQNAVTSFLDLPLCSSRSKYMGFLRDVAQCGIVGVGHRSLVARVRSVTRNDWCGIAATPVLHPTRILEGPKI